MTYLPARTGGVVTADQNPHQTNITDAGSRGQQLGLDAALRMQGSGGPAPLGDTATSGPSALAYIMAFAVLIFLLWLINKTRIGHAILYYLLALAVVSTLLVNYKWLAGVLAPLAPPTRKAS